MESVQPPRPIGRSQPKLLFWTMSGSVANGRCSCPNVVLPQKNTGTSLVRAEARYYVDVEQLSSIGPTPYQQQH